MRAAVAKLQEVSQQVSNGAGTASGGRSANDEDAENISRTLLLAQRTADSTIAQANSDAESITVKARVDADAYVKHDVDWYDGSIRGLDTEMERLFERLKVYRAAGHAPLFGS